MDIVVEISCSVCSVDDISFVLSVVCCCSTVVNGSSVGSASCVVLQIEFAVGFAMVLLFE